MSSWFLVSQIQISIRFHGNGNNMFGRSLKLLVLHRSATWFLTILFWVNLNKVLYVYNLDLNVMCIIIKLFFYNAKIILL